MKTKTGIFIAVVIMVLVIALSAVILFSRTSALFKPQANTTQQIPDNMKNDREQKNGLVAGFPDFPMPEGMQIESSRYAKDEQGGHYEAVGKSNGTMMGINDWYIKKLKSKGWNLLSQENDKKHEGTLVFSKEDMKVGIDFDQESPNETEVAIKITILQ